MDRELPDDDRARIRKIAEEHPEVRAVHDIKTRAAGPTAFIQLHLEMDGRMTLSHAHEISDAVEASLHEAFPGAEIIIHQDPEGVAEPRLSFTQVATQAEESRRSPPTSKARPRSSPAALPESGSPP